MVHIVWRERADNPWLSMAKDIVLRFLPPPGEDAQTCGPGPFSMSSETAVRAMMIAAGYDEIEFRRVDAPVVVVLAAASGMSSDSATGKFSRVADAPRLAGGCQRYSPVAVLNLRSSPQRGIGGQHDWIGPNRHK